MQNLLQKHYSDNLYNEVKVTSLGLCFKLKDSSIFHFPSLFKLRNLSALINGWGEKRVGNIIHRETISLCLLLTLIFVPGKGKECIWHQVKKIDHCKACGDSYP